MKWGAFGKGNDKFGLVSRYVRADEVKISGSKDTCIQEI